MGRSESSRLFCTKHPKHRQSPGVCSCCLREKLSQLYKPKTTTTTTNTTTSSSPTSSLSSLSSSLSTSSSSSPISYHHDGITRSRSMVIYARNRLEELRIKKSNNKKNNNKKKDGFWLKLLRLNGSKKKNKDVLMHSKTMIEGRTYTLH